MPSGKKVIGVQYNIRELFPNGKPEPEEFIRVMAQIVLEQMERERSQVDRGIPETATEPSRLCRESCLTK